MQENTLRCTYRVNAKRTYKDEGRCVMFMVSRHTLVLTNRSFNKIKHNGHLVRKLSSRLSAISRMSVSETVAKHLYGCGSPTRLWT